MGPYNGSRLLIIFETRACGPKYQTRSAAAPHKDHTISSLSVTSVWLCITLLTSKIHCSNETSPYWVGSPLKALNFGILPTTCGVTLQQEFSHHGTDVVLNICTWTPSFRTFSSLSARQSPTPNIICCSVAISHPVCTL